MHVDHEDEVEDFVSCCLLISVPSERVCRIRRGTVGAMYRITKGSKRELPVMSIFQVLFDDPQAGHAIFVELKLSPAADKVVWGFEELGQRW